MRKKSKKSAYQKIDQLSQDMILRNSISKDSSFNPCLRLSSYDLCASLLDHRSVKQLNMRRYRMLARTLRKKYDNIFTKESDLEGKDGEKYMKEVVKKSLKKAGHQVLVNRVKSVIDFHRNLDYEILSTSFKPKRKEKLEVRSIFQHSNKIVSKKERFNQRMNERKLASAARIGSLHK